MYAFVFASRTSFVFVLILLLSIFLQPIETIFADTSLPLTPPQIEIIEDEVVSTGESLPVLDTDAEVIGVTSQGQIMNEVDSNFSGNELVQVETESIEESGGSTTSDSITGNLDSESNIDQNSLLQGEFENSAPEATTSTSIATTTDQNMAPVTAVSYGDSVVQFDKDSCVSVSDGSYYCQSETSEGSVRSDGVYAFPDKDGDLEIFVQAGDDLTQLTFNTEDDSSPHFDGESNTMVWHRLINDRYQIISYDVTSGEETQLTDDNVNNMEPTRSGSFTVWQQWDNNWEIVLYDGKTKRQLTHSVEHDVSPSIRNGLVVWYKLTEGSDKSIQLYNIKTAEFTTIEDSDGGTISNPRMVVVYETTYENGDVVTKGYDLVTGEIISLDAIPVELPDTLPNPDSTGETRALLQSKVTTKEDVDTEQATPTAPPPPSNSGEFDLVIGTSSTSLITEAGIAPQLGSTTTASLSQDFTLNLSLPKPPPKRVQFEIEDVVITTFSTSTNISASE